MVSVGTVVLCGVLRPQLTRWDGFYKQRQSPNVLSTDSEYCKVDVLTPVINSYTATHLCQDCLGRSGKTNNVAQLHVRLHVH